MTSLWSAASRLALNFGVKVAAPDLRASVSEVPTEVEPEAVVAALALHGLKAVVLKSGQLDPTLKTPLMLQLKDGEWAVLDERFQLFRIVDQNWRLVASGISDANQFFDGLLIQVASVESAYVDAPDYTEAVSDHWFFSKLLLAKKHYIDAAVATFLINILALSGSMFAMNVYDRIVPNSAFVSLWTLAIGVVLAAVLEFVLKISRSVILDNTGKKIDLVLFSELLAKTMNIKSINKPGSSVNLAGQVRDFETVREFVSSSSLVAITDLPFAFLFLFVIYFVAGSLVVVPVIAFLLTIVAGMIVGLLSKNSITRFQYENNQKYAFLVETLDRLEVIDALGAKSRVMSVWEQLCSTASQSALHLKHLTSYLGTFNMFVSQVASVVLIVMGVYLISGGHLSVGALVACSILLSRILSPAAQVSSLIGRWTQTSLAYDQMNKLMALPGRYEHKKTYLTVDSRIQRIDIQGLEFQYAKALPVTLSIPKLAVAVGQVVAVMGPVGSGKSTLLRLIAGLLDPTRGSTSINGFDSTSVSPSQFRSLIAWQGQETLLFKGSLKDNLLIGNQQVDDQLLGRVISMCEIDKFEGFQKFGLNLSLGENGLNLSGGQRQLLALARTLLSNRPVIVLDEPTSMLDLAQELRVVNSIKAFASEKIVLIATHRQAPLTVATHVFVLDKGVLVAAGPRDEVLDAVRQGNIARADTSHLQAGGH